MANPIWKDYPVLLGSGDGLSYRIVLHDTQEVIYAGRAYKRPGQPSNIIRINDICADYFSNTLPTISQSSFSELDFPITFDVLVYNAGTATWDTVDSVAFDNNWSYDYDYDPETMGLSFPIISEIDPRQPIVISVYDAESVTATVYFKDGTSFQVIIPVARTNDFNNDFNFDFARTTRASASGTAVLLPSAWPNCDRVVVGLNTYKVKDACAKYALYYVNAYGGWDTLLVEGNDIESDTFERFVRMVEYDNSSITNRGMENYLNEITKTFQLHTGWMTDEQSKRMRHLTGSTCVYLYDLASQQMIPIVITDNSQEYKTYKNQGNRMVNYTLQAQLAQNRIRR